MSGSEFHGEFVGDASGGEDLLLYPAGSVTALTLASNQRVVITDVWAYCATGAKVCSLTNGADAAGKRIFKIKSTSNVFNTGATYPIPYYCTQGQIPQVNADDGTTWEIFVNGFIQEV